MKQIEVKETKTVWVVWGNYDLKEGKGHNYPLYVCASKEKAESLGKGEYVKGTDCPVTPEVAFRPYGRTWFAPCEIL